jgi:hypothetical protein
MDEQEDVWMSEWMLKKEGRIEERGKVQAIRRWTSGQTLDLANTDRQTDI